MPDSSNITPYSPQPNTYGSKTNAAGPSANDIEVALIDGAKRYFGECRQRIPLFTQQYFSYPGCWQTNKMGIGWDMLRTPINLFWAPVYVLINLLAIGFEKLGWPRIAKILKKTPTGFTTRVQRYIRDVIVTELLQRPNACSSQPTNTNKPDRFRECVLAALEEKLEDTSHHAFAHDQIFSKFDALIGDTLEQYNVTRTASSDITNVATSTIFGAFAFQKFTPGSLGLGFLLAAAIAKENATSGFIFGETLGGIYYHMFPPSPNTTLTIASTLGVVTFLALFSAISGLLSDPFQYWTRLHHARLRKMINNLEIDFIDKTTSRFRPKDQYVARVLDIFDAIKSHLI